MAFPHRNVVSGITVNEGGISLNTPIRLSSFLFALVNKSTHPKPPFSNTNKGVITAANLSRNNTQAQRCSKPTNEKARMKFSMNIDCLRSAPHRTKIAEIKSDKKGYVNRTPA